MDAIYYHNLWSFLSWTAPHLTLQLSVIICFKPMQFCWFLKGCQVKTYNCQFVPHNLRYGDGEKPCGIFYLYIREMPDTEMVHKQWQRGSHSSRKEAVILMIKAVVCSEDWFWNTDSPNLRTWIYCLINPHLDLIYCSDVPFLQHTNHAGVLLILCTLRIQNVKKIHIVIRATLTLQ